VSTPLKSGTWSIWQLGIGAAALGAVGFFTAGRETARHLAALVVGMAVLFVATPWVSSAVQASVGRYLASPDYPLLLALGIAVAAVVALVVAARVGYKLTRSRLSFVTHGEMTFFHWAWVKALSTVMLPILAFLIVRALDLLIFGVAPGVHL